MTILLRPGVILALVLATAVPPCRSQILEVTVRTAAELQSLFTDPVDSVSVRVAPGFYELAPSEAIDSTCGNCEDGATLVSCSVGLHIRGAYVEIRGPEDRSAVIHTNSGYGLYFERCRSAIVENLTITGGKRDPGSEATDAAIVAKHSRVIVRNNRIVSNIGDPWIVEATVVGVMGICGREGSDLTISGNEIIGNSWDGVALFRDAHAVIEENIIDGVDKARGGMIGGGRGVGIAATWNARAEIRRNLVTRYWKGIGLFVDAWGIVEENIVEDILTWGISLWDAGKGVPTGFIRRNIIYSTGACGASITRSTEGFAPGEFTDNIIVESGQSPKYDAEDYYCYQCALSLQSIPSRFRIEGNRFQNNRRATSDLPDWDMDPTEFVALVKQYCPPLVNHPALQQSGFVRDFCFQR